MSALRKALGWLWAAVWLRWRLAAVKMRGLVVRRPAVAGAGYHLAPVDVPVEGVDYDVEELPAGLLSRLEDTRSELLDGARRTASLRIRRHRTRRRTLSLMTAGLVTLAMLGAGATALVTGSTGVPEVDRWLGIYEAKLDKPRKPDRFGPGGRDVRPQPSAAGPVIEVPFANGSRRVIVVSYASRRGDICATVTDVDRVGETGSISCVTGTFLTDRLRGAEGLVLGGVSTHDAGLLVGIVAAEVDRVSARGPRGLLESQLGASWSPDIAGIDSVRTFVATESPRRGVISPHDYVVRAQIGEDAPTEIRP